jgi:deoxyhypusine monooxygenase
MNVVPEKRLALFAEMENRYEKKDVDYFVKLLDSDDYVVRTRATCILWRGGQDTTHSKGSQT